MTSEFSQRVYIDDLGTYYNSDSRSDCKRLHKITRLRFRKKKKTMTTTVIGVPIP